MCICRMRSRDLPKLRSFIQDWVDEYYNARKNKVNVTSDLGGGEESLDSNMFYCSSLFTSATLIIMDGMMITSGRSMDTERFDHSTQLY